LVVFRRQKALEAHERKKSQKMFLDVIDAWVGGWKSKIFARASFEQRREKRAEESHSTKERKRVQQHMRQPWSDKSNFADLNCRRFVPLTSFVETLLMFSYACHLA
jgi:hypothetical protein